mmetsp:Transcript_83007/g.231684  ORF Transcript_83007/g.231684 Transcript_83007/m.231684 type:complete len:238 (-) Transcript_83007:96-809(-)
MKPDDLRVFGKRKLALLETAVEADVHAVVETVEQMLAQDSASPVSFLGSSSRMSAKPPVAELSVIVPVRLWIIGCSSGTASKFLTARLTGLNSQRSPVWLRFATCGGPCSSTPDLVLIHPTTLVSSFTLQRCWFAGSSSSISIRQPLGKTSKTSLVMGASWRSVMAANVARLSPTLNSSEAVRDLTEADPLAMVLKAEEQRGKKLALFRRVSGDGTLLEITISPSMPPECGPRCTSA